MRLSPLSYYADFFLAAALILVLAVSVALETVSTAQALESCASAAAGFVFWTAMEYFVHRVLYHHAPYFTQMHNAHHAQPNAFIGAPPVIGLVLIVAITYVPAMYFHEIAARCMTMGMLAGYMGYMLLHHSAHYWRPRKGSWLWRARRHHALHHHLGLEGNYGIVTSFWDHVFDTSLEGRRPNSATERT